MRMVTVKQKMVRNLYKYEVCSLLCINDEEKSGVVLGYFLYISQLTSRRPKACTTCSKP